MVTQGADVVGRVRSHSRVRRAVGASSAAHRACAAAAAARASRPFIHVVDSSSSDSLRSSTRAYASESTTSSRGDEDVNRRSPDIVNREPSPPTKDDDGLAACGVRKSDGIASVILEDSVNRSVAGIDPCDRFVGV